MANLKLSLALLILCLLSTITSAKAIEHEKDEAPLIQPEIITEFRETTLTVSANLSDAINKSSQACRSQALEKEKIALLKRLKKPKKSADYTQHHIRYRLLSAIDGFQRYGERAEAGIERKREMMRGLSGIQSEVSRSSVWLLTFVHFTRMSVYKYLGILLFYH